MAARLASIASGTFDVLVVGGGINGSASALELARRGYSVLLVEKGDFGSGTSSRSTRLLHLGLRYFANGSPTPIRSFLRHPQSLFEATRMAKQAMKNRDEFILERSSRVNRMKVYFPVERDGSYRPYHVGMGLTALSIAGKSTIPIGSGRLTSKNIADHGLLAAMNERSPLQAVFTFQDYQFDWPERIINDMLIETLCFGSIAINYCELLSASFDGKIWNATLKDNLSENGEVCGIKARCIVNASGIWLDGTNKSIGLNADRKITGTKGSHIAIRLPEEFSDFAIMTMNSHGQPVYCIPWKGIHYVGATETQFIGDIDDIFPEEEEIFFLLNEARLLLPTLDLQRSDVLYAWSGVRPWTYDKAMLEKYVREGKLSNPIGSRRREVHDLSEPDAKNVIGLTAGPIMLHRESGKDIANSVQKKIGEPGRTRHAVRSTGHVASDQVLKQSGDVARAVQIAVEREQANGLVDIMFRRLGLGWSQDMGTSQVADVARELGKLRRWPEEKITEEIAAYHQYLNKYHHYQSKPAIREITQ